MAWEDRLLTPSGGPAAHPAFSRPLPSQEPPAFRGTDARRVRQRIAACPEIDCLRHRLPPGTLAAAELRAAEVGIGADQVLISGGLIAESDFARTFASHHGISFDGLETFVRADCPLNENALLDTIRTGTIRLTIEGEDILAVAPHGYGARHLIAALSADPALARRIRITTRACIERFLRLHAPSAVGRYAAFSLKNEQPQFSAAYMKPRVLFLGALCVCTISVFAPKILVSTFDILLALIFMGWIVLRLLGALTTGILWRRRVQLRESELPIYTVIVALYKETETLRGLVSSLAAFDYPHEKLEIKLVIEPDDWEMRNALAEIELDSRFEVIVAPAVGPRTKPKALNAALPFARGAIIAVYDAEDRPDADQLRLALHAFSIADDRLACVQARLTIDNSRDSTLTRLFTAEYAGLFDVFLPGIAAWRLPLPLGGSSNHFRATALRAAGAWDPYNVTEDADLGMRLSRLGYRAAVIDSATYEEAPIKFAPWLRQRTRWFKGWMQTWLVHMRHPVRLLNDLGLAGFVVFQLVVGGTVLAALVHSLFATAFIWQIATEGLNLGSGDIGAALMAGLHGTTLISGYAISAILALIGLARRRLLHCAWSLVLTPVYWIMLSIAAWRALYQIIREPYRWEKTEHGLAKTSRLAAQKFQSPL